MKQKTIFDILGDLTIGKVKWEDQGISDRKQIQPWMLQRWLSMHPDYLDLVASVQPYTDLMELREYYKFWLDLLPKQKFFTKYVSSKVKVDEVNERLINFISTDMNISKKESEQVYQILSMTPSGLNKLKDALRRYGIEEKEIKKGYGL